MSKEETKTDKGNKTQDMAEERTLWAEDRTILSNERTFSSRLGLALGSLGLAIGLQGVFKEVDPTWAAKVAASIFVLVAIYVALFAYKSAIEMKARLDAHCAEPSSGSQLRTITAIVVVGAIGVGIVLWLA